MFFPYLSVLLSIIIGLGITQLLAAAGRLIWHRNRVRVDWLPLLWGAVLLVIFVQVWWSMFDVRFHRFGRSSNFWLSLLRRRGGIVLFDPDQPLPFLLYSSHSVAIARIPIQRTR